MNNSRKRKSEDDLRGGDGSASPSGPRDGEEIEAGPPTTAAMGDTDTDVEVPNPPTRGLEMEAMEGGGRARPGFRPCDGCGCLVPESNWLMHGAVCGRVRGGRGRAGSPPPASDGEAAAAAAVGVVSAAGPSGSASGDNRGGSSLMGGASVPDVIIEGVDDGIEARHVVADRPGEGRHDATNSPSASATSPGPGSTPRRRLPLPPEDDLATALGPGQWQCGACTLINEPRDRACSACATPRGGAHSAAAHAPSPDGPAVRPPDRVRSERILDEHGWVDVTGHQFPRVPRVAQFPRLPRGGVRITNNNTFNFHGTAGGPPDNINGNNNQAVGAIPTATRILNGLFNGAIVGSVMGGFPGLVIGGLAGAAMGSVVDRTSARRREEGLAEADRVASMLANDMGGIQAGTVRVHRGDTHITALARNRDGQSRVVRVRYDASDPRFRALRGRRSDAESELLSLLIRMSYGNRNGGHDVDGVVLQPEQSFEELLERFGIGTENRGASREVIASYPVETIVGDGGDDVESSSDDGKPSAAPPLDRRGSGLHGTCSICLEENRAGDKVKRLSCGHVFHAACIDEWLGRNAVCPCCKADVAGYVGPPAGAEDAYLGCD